MYCSALGWALQLCYPYVYMIPGTNPKREWFAAPTLELAQQLIGTYLVRELDDGQIVGGVIVETEAYLTDDPACHGYRGKTQRNAVLFGEPGYAYVYFIYGMYHCFNVVSAPAGAGEAVLVRAVQPRWGQRVMRANRGGAKDLCSGPGRLAQALGITTQQHNGVRLSEDGPLHIRLPAAAERISIRNIVATPRIGLSVAADKLWRFAVVGERTVSRPVPQRGLYPAGVVIPQ